AEDGIRDFHVTGVQTCALPIFGVFLLAFYRRATARGAFYGLIAGMSAVAAVTFLAPQVSFLWHNVIGAGTVFIVGVLLSWIAGARPAAVAAEGVAAEG